MRTFGFETSLLFAADELRSLWTANEHRDIGSTVLVVEPKNLTASGGYCEHDLFGRLTGQDRTHGIRLEQFEQWRYGPPYIFGRGYISVVSHQL